MDFAPLSDAAIHGVAGIVKKAYAATHVIKDTRAHSTWRATLSGRGGDASLKGARSATAARDPTAAHATL